MMTGETPLKLDMDGDMGELETLRPVFEVLGTFLNLPQGRIMSSKIRKQKDEIVTVYGTDGDNTVAMTICKGRGLFDAQ